MAKGHETVVAYAMMRLSKMGARVFKNAQGQAFAGRVVEEYEDSAGHCVTLAGARRLRFGVCNPGGSDLIGWRPIEITREMVGQTLAQFVAVECKTDGYSTASKEQKQFLGEVAKAGGVAVIARREGEDAVSFEEIEP
jgi:hypothetical protein